MELTEKEKEVRRFLIKWIRDEKDYFIFYQDLSNACKLGFNMQLDYDSTEMGKLLSNICIFEHNKGRPLLSGIVIRNDKEKGFVYGNGFYVLYKQLFPKEWKNSNRDSEFTTYIMEKCYEFWMNDTYHLAFKDDDKT